MRSMARLRHSSSSACRHSSTACRYACADALGLRGQRLAALQVAEADVAVDREVALPGVHDVEDDHLVVVVAQMVEAADDRGEVAEAGR